MVFYMRFNCTQLLCHGNSRDVVRSSALYVVMFSEVEIYLHIIGTMERCKPKRYRSSLDSCHVNFLTRQIAYNI